LSGSENCVCERQKLAVYGFIDCSQRKDLRIQVVWENVAA